MTKKPLLQNSFGGSFSAITLTILSVGVASNANATREIMNQYHAPTCQTCHIYGDYSKSEGHAGLNALVAARAAVEAAYVKLHRPKISAISKEWDVEAEQALSPIALSVDDYDQDAFKIIGTFPKGSSFSPVYTESGNGLPTVDFNWTPTVAQANHVYTVKFIAKETLSARKLGSLPVTAKIRVWPVGNRDQAFVKNIIVSTHKWVADKLTLKGSVVLNPIMTAKEKSDFLKRTDLTVNITQGTDGNGVAISNSLPITLKPINGNWILANIDFPAQTPFTCSMTIEFEGKHAARKIIGAPKGCVK